MGTSHRIRLTVGLDREHMPSFIPGAKTILGKLGASSASFPALPVSTATLGQQIDDVETVHLQTKTTRGLIPLRTAKVDIAWNSLTTNCTYCQGICQQGAVLIVTRPARLNGRFIARRAYGASRV